MNPVYETALTVARVAAYGHGYAVCVHGSGTRDLDLVAIPWTDEAREMEQLVGAILSALDFEFGERYSVRCPDLDKTPNEQAFWPAPVKKPHGRIAYTIHIGASLHLDLSVMPRVE
jgi:hypothetical protein